MNRDVRDEHSLPGVASSADVRPSGEREQAPIRLFGREYLPTGGRGKLWVYLIALADLIARPLLGRTHRLLPPKLDGETIVVAKIDHLGDLLMITPVLRELRVQVPSARLVLLVGSWSATLAKDLRARGLADDVVIYDAWALNRSAGALRSFVANVRTWMSAGRRLRELVPAVFLDLRPFSPNALLLGRLTRIRYRVGFGLRGFAYTLHAVIPYTLETPVGQACLDALPLLGLRGARYCGPVLPPPSGAEATLPARVANIHEQYVVVHCASGDPRREIPDAEWLEVLTRVATQYRLVLVGTHQDELRQRQLIESLPAARTVNLMGQTSIGDLATVVEHSSGGVVVDSVVAHLLLAFAKPMLVLVGRFTPATSFPQPAPSIRFLSEPRSHAQLHEAGRWLTNTIAAEHGERAGTRAGTSGMRALVSDMGEPCA